MLLSVIVIAFSMTYAWFLIFMIERFIEAYRDRTDAYHERTAAYRDRTNLSLDAARKQMENMNEMLHPLQLDRDAYGKKS